MFADEGVYVNTNGELVRHAMLQWGETPYAIGKLSCKFITCGNIFRILLSGIMDLFRLSILFSQYRSCDNTTENMLLKLDILMLARSLLMNTAMVPTS